MRRGILQSCQHQLIPSVTLSCILFNYQFISTYLFESHSCIPLHFLFLSSCVPEINNTRHPGKVTSGKDDSWWRWTYSRRGVPDLQWRGKKKEVLKSKLRHLYEAYWSSQSIERYKRSCQKGHLVLFKELYVCKKRSIVCNALPSNNVPTRPEWVRRACS